MRCSMVNQVGIYNSGNPSGYIGITIELPYCYIYIVIARVHKLGHVE